MSESELPCGTRPVPAADARIESVGLRALDRRRVDVAVDLTPCLEPVDVELVIVGPDDDEVCCTRLIQNRQPMLDRVLHLRRDAQPGVHTLHVGLFLGDVLVDQASRPLVFHEPEPEP